MLDVQWKSDDEYVMSRREIIDRAKHQYQGPAQCDQDGLVYSRPLHPELDGHGHTIHRIRLHIPYVVDIQHSHAETPDGGGRQ